MSTEDASPLTTLSQRQRNALALLGITDAEQLAGADEQQLWKELEEAFRLFPDESPLTRGEWEEKLVPLMSGSPSVGNNHANSPAAIDDSFASLTRPLPQLKRRYGSTEIDESAPPAMLPYRRRRKKGIRHQHIGRTLCASVFVLFFYGGIVASLGWLVYILFSVEKAGQRHVIVLFALMACTLPFLMFGWMSKCSVCNIGIFSWKRYRRNRLSHKIPFLGYRMPTALHILLFHWFRCPSCGTPQELRRK